MSFNFLVRNIVGLVLFFIAGWSAIAENPGVLGRKNGSKPNLIVIMTDDMGYQDVGFNGCTDIPTPNIDRIADNGAKCTAGYVTYSVCSPSRAGFLTGRYEQRFGFERNPLYRPSDSNMGLPKDEMTIAASLSEVGYKSGVFGKWHLGAHPSLHPLNRGFDEFYGFLGGGHAYFPELLTIKDSYEAKDERESYHTWIMRNHGHEKIDQYLTDELSEEAVKFVEINRNEPFFLFLSYNAPHAPLQASEKYLSRFEHIKDKKRKTYAAMVSAVDDGVGAVLDKLEELNLNENTIVFFMSDNGGPESKNASDNGVLRAGKGSVYEGGFRVPFAVQWKSVIKPQVYEKPVSSLDVFATISALSNSPVKQGKPLDGVNLIPFFSGEQEGMPHKSIFLRKYDGQKFAVRHGEYKLVTHNNAQRKELYDLSRDLSETNDISDFHSEKLKELDALRLEWNDELIPPVFKGLIHGGAWGREPKEPVNYEVK